MRRKNYSMRAFAQYLNINPSTLRGALLGHHGISAETAKQIAERLGYGKKQTEKQLRNRVNDLIDNLRNTDSIILSANESPRTQSSNVSRAQTYIQQGFIKRARQALTASKLADCSPQNEKAMALLHPCRPDTEIPRPSSLSHLIIDDDSVRRIIKESCTGAAPDLFHWTSEMLKPYLNDDDIIGPFCKFLQLMLTGSLPLSLNDFLLSSRLIALEKTPSGVRPIAIGNLFVKFSSKLSCLQMNSRFETYFDGVQFAVGVGAGAEKMIHRIRYHRNKGDTVLKIDFSKRF